ncbi:hypothetical protein LTR99_003486 [Exophiala xenobiotica]|uniref:FAD-binding FR-type domain-containing protein n=1 Tax=Vermiconidia calcicola TaxID=1690605 RepID=A0AAV9PUU0_9PEZI|nr:hypothetical protein LTR96_008207 [Exophiala xenobiotica]KAK5529143.1 hypothetical protein LTR25_009880 [Vermiconidia calcicola]KAK5547108.1 hypothetical protein LTR23_002747 [Chaetothyriales sp. CCFEE 6169]KAK5305941.1 hypothetical protein LTR99_003486 [Exophiala xenobiotica]KAK5335423.1 hypothetical protein LTR98_008423 [Exophiala xenobiotica]
METVIPSDFHNVLRLSLKSSADLIETFDASPGRGPSPDHIRKIIAAILWHRKFILTYYVVIGFVVAISCAHGIYNKIERRSRKTKGSGTDTSIPSPTVSSSSSTLRGTITPHGKDDDDVPVTENTLLLPQQTAASVQRPLLLHRLKAFLLYQPRPVHAATSPSNVLPNNGTSLLVVLFLGVNMFYLLYRAPLTISWIFILADRAGLLFVANLPVLYILAAKTNQPIKYLTGWSYEGLNLFHRRLGEWMIVVAVIHMLGMFIVWYTILRSLGFDLIRYLTEPTVFLGIAAIISYFIIYITSVGWFRHLYYETFLGLHIFFQVAALTFLFFHYPTARLYVLATFAIWAMDRLLWRITLSTRKYTATLEVAPDGQTVLIHCNIDLRRRLFGIRMGLHHGWLPGQHVFLTIPSMGFKYRFQTHPFTIASPAPPRDANIGSWPLQLVIRSIDGFSLDLLNYARHHQHCQVFLDGPHGGIEALEAAHYAERVCLIAGGSGIAVTYPLAWDVRVDSTMQPEAPVSTRAVYKDGVNSVRSVLECGPLIEFSEFAHFWVRQESSHSRWISMFPRADSVKQNSVCEFCPGDVGKDADQAEDVATIVTHSFDTRSPLSDGGRPDIRTEVWNWVTSSPSTRASSSTLLGCDSPQSLRHSLVNTPNLLHPTPERETRPRKERICLIVSGPDGLVRDVRNTAAHLIREGWDIQVWVEKFGW